MRHPIELFTAGIIGITDWVDNYWWAAVAIILAPLVLPAITRSKFSLAWTIGLLALCVFMLFAKIMYWWAPWAAAWPISIVLILIDHSSKIADQRHRELLQAIRETKKG